MSLHLEFEPHSWYMEFAIKHNSHITHNDITGWPWKAYTDNGNTYRIDELGATTLRELKQKIRAYHTQHRNGYGERLARKRLNYLRTELRAARLSYSELAELQSLMHYIAVGDVELLEAAGVPEALYTVIESERTNRVNIPVYYIYDVTIFVPNPFKKSPRLINITETLPL